MKRLAIWMGAAALLAAGAAFALKAGDTVYVRTRDTKIFAAPDGSAKVVAKLQPGDKLVWMGKPSTDAPRYHPVKTEKGKEGFAWYQNLSLSPPRDELVVDKSGKAKTVNVQAFASYGAASRGLTEGNRKILARVKEEKVKEQFTLLEKLAQKVAADVRRMEKHRKDVGIAQEVR